VILTGEQHQAMDGRGGLRGNADPFPASDALLVGAPLLIAMAAGDFDGIDFQAPPECSARSV
jgi:hypothetical protein